MWKRSSERITWELELYASRKSISWTTAFFNKFFSGKIVNFYLLSDLIWRLDDGKGLSFSYPQIALHAISSDLNAFPHECLYMIVDKNALSIKFYFCVLCRAILTIARIKSGIFYILVLVLLKAG